MWSIAWMLEYAAESCTRAPGPSASEAIGLTLGKGEQGRSYTIVYTNIFKQIAKVV